jgi:hypothetical protein
MRHPKLVEFEGRLKRLFDTVDDYLEDRYGGRFQLHPSRAGRGTTANKEHDGLFNVGATFSPGYGSTYGRGYLVDVEMVTLVHVPADIRETIEQEVARLVNEKLAEYFPERELAVVRDRNVYKIHGDLKLGTV